MKVVLEVGARRFGVGWVLFADSVLLNRFIVSGFGVFLDEVRGRGSGIDSILNFFFIGNFLIYGKEVIYIDLMLSKGLN